MSLAVVTCFFNFESFTKPKANLRRFLRQMQKDRVPVYGIEMSFDGKFVTHDARWSRVVLDPSTQKLWQKEAAINAAARQLPDDISAVAWVDADLWFSNPSWPEDTLEALKRHDVVQLFKICHWLDEHSEIETTSVASGVRPLTQKWESHPGFAWAMRRDLWDKAGGLYPFALSGGGDSIMATSFQGTPKWSHLWNHVGEDRTAYLRWESHFSGISVGAVPGSVFHEWHGYRKDRDYFNRALRMAPLRATRDLEFDKRGLLRWTKEAPYTIVRAAADYFPARREDG